MDKRFRSGWIIEQLGKGEGEGGVDDYRKSGVNRKSGVMRITEREGRSEGEWKGRSQVK
jgi:hypothetical protein